MIESPVINIINESIPKTLYGFPKEGIIAENRIIKVGDGATKQTLYAKLYRTQYELLYEIIGYLIAHHLELPQPKAFVTLLNQDDQRRLFNIQHPKTNKYPVWATESLTGESAWFHYGHCSDALKKDLKKWFNLYGTVAFDDFVGNIDRNLTNLIRESSGKYHLIDHGKLFGGRTYKTKKVHANEFTKNLLGEACIPAQSLRRQEKSPILNIAQHASRHADAFEKSKPELYYWWSRLAKGHERKLYNYLSERSKIETHIIQRKYGLLAI
ncbi:hypothetical protein [Thiomicrorhabdus sp.]|uniref:hypothetical protein n=1 Tax=Thiomicrorhabdus sp. TaxID=2039724 RepID=UPI0029C7DF5F|nr:hypothetical protein [Thiomicrorhabdus sp.]